MAPDREAGHGFRSACGDRRVFAASLYKPGVHFFSAPSSDLPDLIDWLLRDPAGQQAAEEVLANVELPRIEWCWPPTHKGSRQFITANS